MKHSIKLSAMLTLGIMLLVTGLSSLAPAQQPPPKKGAIGAGGAGLYGVKAKTRKRVNGRKIIGTTYGGNGQSTVRQGARSKSRTQKITAGATTSTNPQPASPKAPNR